jgi:PAS domain-containing protein
MVICPVVPTRTNRVIAFLVLALNPGRPYDDDYRDFIHALTEQITTAQFSAAPLREEAERRTRISRQQTIDTERLSKELLQSEQKFTRFATRAPTGFAIFDGEGICRFANGKCCDYLSHGGAG